MIIVSTFKDQLWCKFFCVYTIQYNDQIHFDQKFEVNLMQIWSFNFIFENQPWWEFVYVKMTTDNDQIHFDQKFEAHLMQIWSFKLTFKNQL